MKEKDEREVTEWSSLAELFLTIYSNLYYIRSCKQRSWNLLIFIECTKNACPPK